MKLTVLLILFALFGTVSCPSLAPPEPPHRILVSTSTNSTPIAIEYQTAAILDSVVPSATRDIRRTQNDSPVEGYRESWECVSSEEGSAIYISNHTELQTECEGVPASSTRGSRTADLQKIICAIEKIAITLDKIGRTIDKVTYTIQSICRAYATIARIRAMRLEAQR